MHERSFVEQLESALDAIEAFLNRCDVVALAEQVGPHLNPDDAIAGLDFIARFDALPPTWKPVWDELPERPSSLLRWILALAAQRSVKLLPTAMVGDEVRRMTLRGCAAVVDVKAVPDQWLQIGRREFRQHAEVVRLKRFVAGQVHWTVSGIPRKWLLEMAGHDALRCLRMFWHMGGRGPCFEAHLPATPFLVRREYERAYLRIAEAMELQDTIRGVIGASWLHSEETMQLSPHLAWMNELVSHNGGILLHLGEAPADSGFLVGSQRRKELYDSGAYRPRTGLFVWPRKAFLRWAQGYLQD